MRHWVRILVDWHHPSGLRGKQQYSHLVVVVGTLHPTSNRWPHRHVSPPLVTSHTLNCAPFCFAPFALPWTVWTETHPHRSGSHSAARMVSVHYGRQCAPGVRTQRSAVGRFRAATGAATPVANRPRQSGSTTVRVPLVCNYGVASGELYGCIWVCRSPPAPVAKVPPHCQRTPPASAGDRRKRNGDRGRATVLRGCDRSKC